MTYICHGYRIERIKKGHYEIFDKAGNLTLQPPFRTLGEARKVIREIMCPVDRTMEAV